MNQNRLLFIQIQRQPLSMHHKWQQIIDFDAKQPLENLRGPTPVANPIELKG